MWLVHKILKQKVTTSSNKFKAQGADAAGWLHQGMANRLAIDMGLNLDAASLKQDISISTEEVDLRRQIYWALYCVDKLSAAYTGRVCTFLVSEPCHMVHNLLLNFDIGFSRCRKSTEHQSDQ